MTMSMGTWSKRRSVCLLLVMVLASILCYAMHEYAINHEWTIIVMLTTIASIPLAVIGMAAAFDVLGLTNDDDHTRSSTKENPHA